MADGLAAADATAKLARRLNIAAAEMAQAPRSRGQGAASRVRRRTRWHKPHARGGKPTLQPTRVNYLSQAPRARGQAVLDVHPAGVVAHKPHARGGKSSATRTALSSCPQAPRARGQVAPRRAGGKGATTSPTRAGASRDVGRAGAAVGHKPHARGGKPGALARVRRLRMIGGDGAGVAHVRAGVEGSGPLGWLIGWSSGPKSRAGVQTRRTRGQAAGATLYRVTWVTDPACAGQAESETGSSEGRLRRRTGQPDQPARRSMSPWTSQHTGANSANSAGGQRSSPSGPTRCRRPPDAPTPPTATRPHSNGPP